MEGERQAGAKARATSKAKAMEYQVQLPQSIQSHDMNWKIITVFNRLIVDDVQVGGMANSLDIRKSDVLIKYNEEIVTEENIPMILHRLNEVGLSSSHIKGSVALSDFIDLQTTDGCGRM